MTAAGAGRPETSSAAPDQQVSPAISVGGLCKRYGDLVVLDGLNLEVGRGELFALLGPNGAGKTTTVEILEGYRRPDAGQVSVLGLDAQHSARALRPRLGLMLQDGGIPPQARPRELLRLHAAFFAEPAEPDALLDLVGLTGAANRPYRVLSGGERQCLSLGLALIGRPEILILDEPTAGMDPAAKETVRGVIGQLRAAGRTILLTTHDLADAERLADRVGVLDRGRLIALGSPSEVIAGGSPTLRFRVGVALPAPDMAALAAALGGTLHPEGEPGRYRLAGRLPDPRLVATLATWTAERGLLLHEMRASGGSLEERFLELVRESEDRA